MKLPDKVYNFLKWFVLIFLNALSVFYFAISEIWHLPYATEICGTIAAVGVFLGALIGVSNKNYYAEIGIFSNKEDGNNGQN